MDRKTELISCILLLAPVVAVKKETWFTEKGCLWGHNTVVKSNIPTIEECRALCLAEPSLDCRGIEFNPSDAQYRCVLSNLDKFTVVPLVDLRIPCTDEYAQTELSTIVTATPGWGEVKRECVPADSSSETNSAAGNPTIGRCKEECEANPDCVMIKYHPPNPNPGDALCTLSTKRIGDRMVEYEAECSERVATVERKFHSKRSFPKQPTLAGKRGSGTNVVLGLTSARDFLFCALKCSRHGHCASFAYSDTSKDCELYRAAALQTNPISAPGFQIYGL